MSDKKEKYIQVGTHLGMHLGMMILKPLGKLILKKVQKWWRKGASDKGIDSAYSPE